MKNPSVKVSEYSFNRFKSVLCCLFSALLCSISAGIRGYSRLNMYLDDMLD